MRLSVRKDYEKARAIRKMIGNRKIFVRDFKDKVDVTIICENYYEIVKELATALFLCRGIKFIGNYAHKELIKETIRLLDLDESFFILFDDLRLRRNGSLYYGEGFERNYLVNNEGRLKILIDKIEKGLVKELEIGE